MLAPRSPRGINAEGNRDLLRHIAITSPSDGDTVADQVDIRGSTVLPYEDDFQFYKVELGVGEQPTSWSVIGDIHRTPVIDGTLATLDTSNLPEGIYTVQLTVVDREGNFLPPDQVQITIRR